MNEYVEEYLKYVASLQQIKKPKMPKIAPSAYTDNEYTNAINQVMDEFEFADDYNVTINFLKGE